ncbi:unnamed protein product, partial [Iphiclides podalirius]
MRSAVPSVTSAYSGGKIADGLSRGGAKGQSYSARVHGRDGGRDSIVRPLAAIAAKIWAGCRLNVAPARISRRIARKL